MVQHVIALIVNYLPFFASYFRLQLHCNYSSVNFSLATSIQLLLLPLLRSTVVLLLKIHSWTMESKQVLKKLCTCAIYRYSI